MNRKYRPSNGTEGCGFTDHFCANCINEKFMHTQKHGDIQCDILNRTMLHELNDKEYPEEWQYDDNGRPTCTAWVKWDWGDDGNFNEPPTKPIDDPNQLCFPFLFDELSIPKLKEQLA